MMERRKNCEGGGGGDFVEREEEDEWEDEVAWLQLDGDSLETGLDEKINLDDEEEKVSEVEAVEAEAFLLPDLDEGGFLGSMMMLEEEEGEAVEEATTMAEEFEEEVVDAEEE